MQNDVFNPVADTVNRRSELLLKEQNCFTVIDESIPSPREIQSEDTIVLPEIVSMTDYIRRHYEKEIICACMNQIYGLQLCVMYEGKLFHDVPGLGPIDYGEEELILTDELSPGEWGEPCEFEHQPRVYAADVRPVDGSITWMSFRRIADGCIEADLTIEMEFYFRYGGHGRFKQITTENFLLQLLDPSDNENVLMEMSADGNVGFKQLYADEVISDSVAQAYAGSQWMWVDPSIETPTSTDFRSLGEAVEMVNNRFISGDVYIFLPYGQETYEPNGVVIRGVFGPGRLIIYGYGEDSILNSYIQVQGCFAHICFQSLHLRESRSLNGTSRQPYLCEVTKCHFVEFNSCTLDANSITYDSVYARSSHVFLYSCGLYNALQGLECYLAKGNVKDCCGSCSWSMVSYASLIIASGTVPAGSRGTGENGLLYASSVTTDYGTAITPVTPDENGVMYATTTRSWRGSWRTDTYDVIQGVYSESGYYSSLNWHRGCMWFSSAQSLLSGCTVKSATLTLHRKTGSGSSSAKTVYLCAITNTSASGTPSIAYNYGAIGTIGRDKQVTFSIPVDAVQGLADGWYGGLCIFETPYDFGSSTYSNAYMRMSGTDTSYEPYIECVFSGSTAVG